MFSCNIENMLDEYQLSGLNQLIDTPIIKLTVQLSYSPTVKRKIKDKERL